MKPKPYNPNPKAYSLKPIDPYYRTLTDPFKETLDPNSKTYKSNATLMVSLKAAL